MRTVLFFSTLLLSFSLFAKSDRPNIIFVITDDMGWGDVGFNGQKRYDTPHIDRLANEGIIFDAFYSGSTVCGPSRASLMTGRHQGNAKIRGNPGWNTSGRTIDLDDGDMTIAKELKRAGYTTACIGKWGLNEDLESGTGHPLKQGFDRFVGYNTHKEAHFHWAPFIWRDYEKEDWGGESNWEEKRIYSNDVFTDEAVKFIDESSGAEDPFFLYLAYTVTHLGITAPEDSRGEFEALNWPRHEWKQRGHYRFDEDLNAAYAGMVSRLDEYMGRIVETLREKGVADDTLIVFTSDNGPHFDKKEFFDSNGAFRGYKRNLTEGGIRMPAFAWWPSSIEKGSRSAEPWAFWDVLPTFCDLAGITPSDETDGLSFVSTFKGKTQTKHEYLYWVFNEGAGPMQAIRFGKWKGLRLWNMKKMKMGPLQLYDLDNDPGEGADVANVFPEVAEQALKLLKKAHVESDEYPLLPHARTLKGKNK